MAKSLDVTSVVQSGILRHVATSHSLVSRRQLLPQEKKEKQNKFLAHQNHQKSTNSWIGPIQQLEAELVLCRSVHPALPAVQAIHATGHQSPQCQDNASADTAKPTCALWARQRQAFAVIVIVQRSKTMRSHYNLMYRFLPSTRPDLCAVAVAGAHIDLAEG